VTERTYNRLLPRVGRQLPTTDAEQALIYRNERDAARNEVRRLTALLEAGCPRCAPTGDDWTDFMAERGKYTPRGQA
jgi:hypothetical protein